MTFHNNIARHGGGAVHTFLATKVRFHGSTTVNFSNNSANLAGVIFVNFCAIHGLLCDENLTVTFTENRATGDGGALFLHTCRSNFTGNSTVAFYNNSARRGGAVYYFASTQYFQGNTNVTLFITEPCMVEPFLFLIHIQRNSLVYFKNNTASLSGGTISSQDNTCIWFTGEATIYFNNNIARQHDGAIHSVSNTSIIFNETSCAIFTSNTAMQQGGTLYLFDKSVLTFGGNSNVTYSNNTALQQGGAVYSA